MWLSEFIYDNEIIPTGFSIFHKDRSSRGGDVLIAVNDKILCSSVSSPPDVEVVSVVLGIVMNTQFIFLPTPLKPTTHLLFAT